MFSPAWLIFLSLCGKLLSSFMSLETFHDPHMRSYVTTVHSEDPLGPSVLLAS